MTVYSLNNSIICYAEFIEALTKNPKDSTVINSLASFNKFYNQYKKDNKTMAEIKVQVTRLTNSSDNDILFSYIKKEQLLAYLHLMIENIEKQNIDISVNEIPMTVITLLQDGMGKLWASDHKHVNNISLREE